MIQLSEEEKSSLFQMLNSRVFEKAATMSLSDMRRSKSGEGTIEGSALAHHYLEGGRSFLDTIYGLAEVKKSPVVVPRRLVHTA